MSPWREIWADFVFEVRGRSVLTRMWAPISLILATMRIVLSTTIGSTRWLNGVGSDLSHAWRRLRRSPAYLLFSVMTIALVLTAVPTMHAVLAFFVWQPNPVPHADRIVQLVAGTQDSSADRRAAWADWIAFRDTQQSLIAVAASRRHETGVTINGRTTRLRGEMVTDDFFAVFPVPMRHGRALGAPDFAADADGAVVMSHLAARRLFGEASSAVGQGVTLGGRRFTIVGVTPAGFSGTGFPLAPPEYWVPMEQTRLMSPSMPAGYFDTSRPRFPWATVTGRLRDDATIARASAEARHIGAALDGSRPLDTARAGQAGDDATRRWSAAPPDDRELATFRPLSLTILGALVLVVLLACTNIANLTLSRAAGRYHDLQLRRSLGATRWQLVRSQLAETVIVVAVAAVLAVLGTQVCLTAMATEVPIAQGLLIWMEPRLTPAVVLGTALSALLCLLVAGVWPAWRVSRAASGYAAATSARPRLRLQRTLIVIQVTGSVALLMATVSMVDATTRSLPDPGIDLSRIGVAVIDLSLTPRDQAQQAALQDALETRLPQVHGIDAVAVSDTLPFGQLSEQLSLFATQPNVATGDGLNTYAIASTPRLWDALAIPIRAGRAFTDDDVRGRRDVVVLSQHNAHALFGTQSAIGRRVWYSRSDGRETTTGVWEVVGVAADTDVRTMGKRDTGLVVTPLHLPQARQLTVVARGETDDAAVAALRDIIRQVDPTVVVDGPLTGWTRLAGFYYFAAALGWVAAAVGTLTLVLVMSGLYGVLATAVAQSRREMAIRLALGSGRLGLIGRVIAIGARPAAYGLVAGMAVGVFFRAGVRGLLPRFADQPFVDPMGLALVPFLIAIATLAATYVPARRAAAVDPLAVLKQDYDG